MQLAKQSTAKTFLVGPILDADGVAKTDEVVGSIKVTKNGTVGAADGSSTLTHDHTGQYKYAAAAGDLDTLGLTEFSLNSGTNAMGVVRFVVVPANVYDSLVAGSASLKVDLETIKTQTVTCAAGVEVGVYVGGTGPAALETTALAIAGYIDTEIGTIITALATAQADLDILTGTDGVTLATTQANYAPAKAGDAMALTSGERSTLTTTILTTQMTESYRGTNAAPTAAQAFFELIAHMGESAIVTTTKTIKKLDGTTPAKTFTLDDATNPTSITETT